MIPKIIHYCWFGRGEMPGLVKKCINSWQLYLPEYKLQLWNEDNFDLRMYPYAREAYKERKFAFVSDVCRLYALKEYGGVYLDTDVEILKPIDNFLGKHKAFSGFEDNNYLTTGMMASVKNGEWVTDLLSLYNNKSFYLSDGSLDLTPNPETITNFMKDKGIIVDNSYQEIDGYCAFYSSEYFCPKSWKTLEINITINTYCIHHFAGSWLPSKRKQKLYDFLCKFIGLKNVKKLAGFYRKQKKENVKK